ncbi:hypothetical protein ACULMC_10960, partial [Xanthomonas arboricola pv. corylina]|uniref:hypothetical protein n=1 Tax=Xanthomonas arboricola TaxID=56448 RepID=UPI004040A574
KIGGTSAAALKWIEIAPKRAVVVVVRDGFVHWARSNTVARKSGLALSAKKNLIEVPEGSLPARSDESVSGLIQMKSARLWFPKEPQGMELVEHIHVGGGAGLTRLGCCCFQMPSRFGSVEMKMKMKG